MCQYQNGHVWFQRVGTNKPILKYNGIRIALTAVHLHMGYFGGSEPKHKINC